MAESSSTSSTVLHVLPNGVRVLALPLPHLRTAAVSVYVRGGSAHETRPQAGLTHFVEHMLFKGTHGRDARRINRDAERLGAEANAHTDKDHLALHLRGLGEHVPEFVAQLADLVLHSTFPADEVERERQVLLHEMTEVDDDPMATAFKLFDSASWGLHAVARPVIGERRLVERHTREQLLALVRERFTAPNIVVVAAGGFDPKRLREASVRAFADAPPGEPARLEAPVWHGGVKSRDLPGSVQTHLVMGFPLPSLAEADPGAALAAAVFGEGMGSPLMDELRERRALLYYAACAADQFESCGQFVVEASTAPAQVHEASGEVLRLLQAHARAVDADDFERGRQQLVVRRLRAAEDPSRLAEDAALELLARGSVTPIERWLEGTRRLTPEDLRTRYAAMLARRPALALTGKVPRGMAAQLRERWEGHGTAPVPARRRMRLFR
ncbi:MAG: insulinase family protein [Rubrivivax sp.]|nr:insulinase family protein [Rubrivivax sp.]